MFAVSVMMVMSLVMLMLGMTVFMSIETTTDFSHFWTKSSVRESQIYSNSVLMISWLSS
jgi:hypothetical protein